MIKKTVFSIALLLSFLLPSETFSNPADPSVRRMVTLPDGRKVEACLAGDEFLSYWRLTDGSNLCFKELKQDGELTLVPVDSMRARRKAMRQRQQQGRGLQIPSNVGHYRRLPLNVLQGQRKVPVIMVQFSDVKFQSTTKPSTFSNMFNTRGYSSGQQQGSVRDYFLTQSNGKLDLQFDVYGPVTLSNEVAYYGEDEDNNTQKNMAELLHETIALADNSIDFSLYDWDGDGEMEQFVIMYAGYGQAEGGGTETIWAHRSTMTAELHDGVIVSAYCCNPELRKINDKPVLCGIGTMCHEFSHCLGLPDLYDVDDVNYGTKYWDIMGLGVHNNNGYTPAGYTGYDKMALGWQEPVVLEKSGHIAGIKPMSEGGDFYMIRNDNHPDEYYLLENRQMTGWDASIPGGGLLVMHIDYDPQFASGPNRTEKSDNTHQRCAIVNADNDEEIDYNDYYNWVDDLRGDLFGYKNHELTDESTPAAMLYNMNIDGSKLMGKPVTNIYEANDKTISFDFENKVANKDIYMMGADNVKIKYTSATDIAITANITNFSKNSYKRKVIAWIWGEGQWLKSNSVTMNLASQKSQETTFTINGLKDDVNYAMALYYYEDDSTSDLKQMTEYIYFKMNQRNNFNISLVREPEITVLSENSATVDFVLHNESMNSFNKPVYVYLWQGSSWHSERPSITQTIEPSGDMKYHFKLSTLDPQTVYQVYLYYNNNGWYQIDNSKKLCSGVKVNKKIKGDVNEDGNVDVADIACIIDIMAGAEANKQADVNEDNNVDVADIASIIDIMAGNIQ
ncbi:MAG: M6 family metalloprotease domain-containing protein [Prevotella sp.]|nr:M6 family metalloprotease domain-containing protein [Prevotella sp.]